jgi:hypothetical protein
MSKLLPNFSTGRTGEQTRTGTSFLLKLEIPVFSVCLTHRHERQQCKEQEENILISIMKSLSL